MTLVSCNNKRLLDINSLPDGNSMTVVSCNNKRLIDINSLPDGYSMTVVGCNHHQCLLDVDHLQGRLHRLLQAQRLLHGVPRQVEVVGVVNLPALHHEHKPRLGLA